ncbi:MAG TPA: SMC family ATPase [Acidimicrobiales bacterium]
MRPLALRLQAFGSYAGEFAIDFARLGRHGVFSITGPTGAGKSTIFDAIVYALYDDLPGFRVNSHIRSQYADPTVTTEVTFEFEADGRHWVLTRTPAQSRPSTRKAGGTVDDPSAVKLEEAGVAGSALTRKRDVGERINELVGLDKAQFEQVVLIPQGKFEEVLKAKTQERADLLAKLFPVDVYIRTTEALRLLASGRKEAYETLTRDRAATEDRITDGVVAIRDLFPSSPAPADTEGGEDIEGTDVGEGGVTGGPGAVDLTGLDDLQAELVGLVAAATASRDEAATGREAARARRADVEERIVRWNRWRSDTEAASAFPEQVAADDAVARDLGRAADVAALGGALASWRQATDRGAALAGEHARQLSAVECHWVDTYDATALDGATSALRLAATVSNDAAALERADAAWIDLETRGRTLDADEADLAARTTALAAAGEATAATAGLRAAAEAASAAATDRAAGRAEAIAAVEGLERDRAAVRDRAEAELRLARLGDQLGSATTAVAEATEGLAELRAAWQAGLAGRLAGHLVDGRPCPTCGATEHPAPATPTAEAPGDDELESAESLAAARIEERQRLEVQVGEARGTLGTLVEVPEASGLEARLQAARTELEAIETAAADQSARRGEVARLVELEATMAAEADRERSALAALSGALIERRTRWSADRDAFVAEHGALASTADRAARLASLATALEGLAANLEATTAAGAARAQALATLSGTIAKFGVDDPAALERWARTDEQIAADKLQLAARAEQRHEVTARIGAYVADGGPEDEPDPNPAIEEERAAVAAHDDLVGRVASMSSRLEAVEAAAAELAEGSEAIAAALAAKEEADTLAALCAGLGSGPDATKLSLKNWVLAYYLRQVLAHANRRLHTMTNGRYALDLSGEHADGRRPWGLDISALDAETGQSRPATTLSGGETFMAALALALGLADVVSAGSNYSIGALFVDEGFGSLDGDSLDTVIEVLRSLQDGGRMVGVISHVQELKDALPNGITIVSTNRGSVADIHYPDA